MAEVRLEATGEDKGAGKLLDSLQRRVEELEAEVQRLRSKPLDIPTDPAEAALRELRAELRRLETAFDRAERAVSFARTRNEIERTTGSARRLANAEATLAARGRELIEFSRRLPPELARGAAAMDRIERQTEQATRAFREFQRTAGTTGRNFGQLVSAVNGLRAGLAGIIAALGVQQLLRFGRALIQVGSDAVETKLSFDRLLPALRSFTGSTELANEVANRLAQTADRLKVPLAGLVDPFNGIVAGGKEAGLTISEINDLFEQSLTSARAFGKGAEDVQRLLTGISQVAGKGVASMEEFRQQIGEAIPNAIPALAKGLSETEGRLVTTAEAIARVSSGTFEADDALRALTRGFELLNSEAAKGQLNTLAGDIGAFERASENARRELADGLEPGLRSLLQTVTALIDENPELIRQLGSIGSAGLEGISSLLSGLEGLQGRLQTTARQALSLAEGLKSLPGGEALFGGLAEKLKAFGQNFAGIEERAKTFFEAVEDASRKAALGSEQSAEDILETFRKNFREAAEAAGASAQEIEQTSKDLAEAVGKISEESLKARQELEKRFAQEIAEFGEVRQETAEETARFILEIERQSQRAREALLKELVESTKRATDERVRLEAEATAKALAEAEKIVAGAKKAAEARITEDEKLSTRRQELEAEANEKILAAQQDFVEKLKKPKADREKLAEELRDKVIEIERDLAEKIAAEQERAAKAAEAAADRRIKAEQRVQEEYQESIDVLRELVETIDEAAQGPEGEGGGLAKVADDAERARDAIEEADDSLGGLLVSLEELNRGDLGNPLENIAGSGLDLLGSGGRDFFEGFNAGAGEAASLAQDFGASLDSVLDAAEGLQGGVREALVDLVDRFADLSEAGAATVDDQRAFADELVRIFDGFGVALDDPVAAIQERLEELRTSQSDAVTALQEANAEAEAAYQDVADAAGEAGSSAEEAGETAAVAWDPLTRTLESVEEAASGAAGAAEEAGVRIEESADGIRVTNEALGETKEAGETAASGLQAVGEAAGQAGTAMGEAGEAAESLKGEIVGEEEAEKLRDLGQAAGQALPSIQPLAEPVQALAAASTSLAESLPAIVAQLEPLKTAAGELLQLLADSEVDFDAIAQGAADLEGPLTAISVSLPLIQLAVSELPEPIKLLQETAQPLFELVVQVAEDDRFGKWGAGLASIAAALPAIPEPLGRMQETLEKLVAQREDISAALQGTADGLAAVGSEDVLAALGELVETVDELVGLVSELAVETAGWKSTLDEVVDDMPELVSKLGELADRLREDVAPGFATAAEQARFFKSDVEAAQASSENAFASIQEDADRTREKITALRAEVQGLAADFQAAAAAASELAQQAAAIQVGSG